jgi:AFG3 family protein
MSGLFGGDKKSHRFRQNVNIKFADVVGMQKSKEEIV